MKLNFTDEYKSGDVIAALNSSIRDFHDVIMSDECGIKFYKTDFLHDIIRITQELCDKRSQSTFLYRTVIGTRECGTFTADDAEILEYWESSAIMGVGLEVIKKDDGLITLSIYTMKPDEIECFMLPTNERSAEK